MKKLLILIIFLSALACTKEDPITLTLENTSLTMYNKDKRNVGASTNSTNPITYTSSNKWIASVDATGNIEAGVLGTAEITVSNGISSQKCSVEVKPKYTFFPEPYFNFNATKTDIKNNILTGKLYETSDSLLYTYNEGDYLTEFLYGYLIGTDGKLRCIGLGFSILSLYTPNFLDYMEERYIPVSYSESIFHFTNKEQNLSIYVDLTYNSEGIIKILFYPYTGTPILKSGINNQFWDEFQKTLIERR
jgi:hypothetical protein